MRNFFTPPDLSEDFQQFRHDGGVFMPEATGLIQLQEELISESIPAITLRRTELINLEDAAKTDIQHRLKAVLEKTASRVQAEAQRISGRVVRIDPNLSAAWIEAETDTSNLIVHRDAANPKIVRATFSVSPTRILPHDVEIPVDQREYDTHRYPIGSELLPGFENQTVSNTPGSTSLMSGSTYHCAPNPAEIEKDFQALYGHTKRLEKGKIPRIFGSIWGMIE